MQEVQTNKSEKLVPIDTSGEAIDIELKEDKVENVKTEEVSSDTPIVEVQEENTPAAETKEEELEEYSVGVKKRIDKLTKKMREAERREQAAIDYAKQVKSESDKLKSTNMVQNESMLVDREKALVNQKEFAKRALEAAINAQDVEKQVAANQEISRLTIEDERLTVEAHGLNLGLAIGHQGQTVRAITELSRTIIQRKSRGSASGSMTVDIGGYRALRQSNLEKFAKAQAEAVLSDGISRALDPMGAADRRVAHNAVSDIEGVETISEGSNMDRRVVIQLAE